MPLVAPAVEATNNRGIQGRIPEATERLGLLGTIHEPTIRARACLFNRQTRPVWNPTSLTRTRLIVASGNWR